MNKFPMKYFTGETEIGKKRLEKIINSELQKRNSELNGRIEMELNRSNWKFREMQKRN